MRRSPSPHRRRRLLTALLLVGLGGLGLAGCRSQARLGEGLAIEQLLPADAALYLSLNQAQMAVFLPAWLAANQAPASGRGLADGSADSTAYLAGQLAGYRALLEPLISRSDRLVLAISLERLEPSLELDAAAEVPTPATAASPGTATLYAVAHGKYPASLFNLALAFDSAWLKSGRAWQHRASGLQIQPCGNELLLISNGAIQTLAAALDQPGAHPIPQRWLTAWAADLAVYVPDPLGKLLSSLPLDPADVPLNGLLINGQLAADGRYAMFMGFEFETAASARLLTPVCRLFFYSLVHQAWPQEAVSILQTSAWTVDGPVVAVSGFQLEASATAGLLHLIP